MLKNQADIRSKIKLEVIWWCFTIILAFFVMLPIMRNVPAFPFFRINAVLIILGVTFTRYIFLLKHSLIARQSKWKMVVIAASTILVFILMTYIGEFNSYLKEEGLQGLLDHLPFNQQLKMLRYLKNEMTFFGVLALISAILLPFRLVISLWRTKNTGKV
jgi:phosphoglycerol transferase MdoB-like AlkP superfamily enzyme